MTAPAAAATVPWSARPWVWVVGVAGVLLLGRFLPASTEFDVALGVVLGAAFVGVVAATIAKTHRWGTRGTQVAAWVSGLGTLAGQVYLAQLPAYDSGIGDALLILVLGAVLIGVAWGTQPPTR